MEFFDGTGSFEDFCRDLFPTAFPQSDVREPFFDTVFEGKHQNTRSKMIKGEDKFVYTLEIPGVNKKDVTLNVENDKLIMQFKDAGRSIRIPQSVDIDQISATCEDGILKVDLPIAAGAKAKKIEIS